MFPDHKGVIFEADCLADSKVTRIVYKQHRVLVTFIKVAVDRYG